MDNTVDQQLSSSSCDALSNDPAAAATQDVTISAAFLAGGKAALDRLEAAFDAEGVKGDATRMAAALNLAAKSPDMAAGEIAAFVVQHVAATPQTPGVFESYTAARVAANEEAERRWTAERQEQAHRQNIAAREKSNGQADDAAPST